MQSNRVRTGIPELDEALRGGFMEGDAVIVAGSAGTGKTTLALQYLVNGITQFGQNGVFVTFEQMPSQIYRDAKNFGWDLPKMEEENKLRVICTAPNLLLGSESILEAPMMEIHPRRVVVDSLTHLAMYVEEKELRKEAYRLLMYFKTKGVSSLYTWETPQLVGQAFSITEVGLSFLVDCVVLLKLVEIKSSMRKALVILKMRGSDHDKDLREFAITPQGIKITAPFGGYEGILTGSPRSAGPEKFAEMLGQARRKVK